jgi:hypothetical protein
MTAAQAAPHAHWQHPKHHRIDQAEDRGIGSNAERQRENGNTRKTGAPAHHAQREPQILPQRFNPAKRIHVPRPFFEKHSVSEQA